MTYFSSYDEPAEGFVVASGREHGLHRLVLAAGRLGPGQRGRIRCIGGTTPRPPKSR